MADELKFRQLGMTDAMMQHLAYEMDKLFFSENCPLKEAKFDPFVDHDDPALDSWERIQAHLREPNMLEAASWPTNRCRQREGKECPPPE